MDPSVRVVIDVVRVAVFAAALLIVGSLMSAYGFSEHTATGVAAGVLGAIGAASSLLIAVGLARNFNNIKIASRKRGKPRNHNN